MYKRNFKWMLMAAVILSLSMSITSCKDDNDSKLTPEEQEQQQAEKASTFWDVVGKLVSVDDVTKDYEGKTFEPTIGLPDPTNATVRIVNTNDMRTAARRFASLVGAEGIDENTSSYEWSDPEIGTMTYNKGGDAANWATVDVNIKAVPSLQKIIYREGGDGDNGKFDGKAYYRFGDVVKRTVTINYDKEKNNDNRGTIDEYWICVRPAFGPEKKQDSHWVCVNTVSDKNYEYYHSKTNGKDYWLPYNLKTDEENMYNFAELLWALCDPETWFKNIDNHHTDGWWSFDGVPFFTDFKKANLKLHNQFFWENVKVGWEKTDIVKKALNLDSFKDLDNIVRNDGVRLLYKGYSWWWKSSWNCELWEAVFTNGTKDEELNMHHLEYNHPEKDMKDVDFDVRSMGKERANYALYWNLDGKYRWAIRHATGKELASNKKFDEKEPIQGVEEVYRYYRDVVPTPDLSKDPETTESSKATKWGFFRPGVFIQDEQGTRWMCIYSWLDDKENLAKSTDRKARFISLDGLTSATENIGNATGQFLNNADLVPESQAYVVAAVLQDMSSKPGTPDWGSTNSPYQEIKDKFNELFGRQLMSWHMERDTTLTYEGKTGNGTIEPLSIFYNPAGGRTAGTQPYFRFVKDASHVGPVRAILPSHLKYPLARAYKKYNDGSGQTLDATHLFTASNYITEAKPVKADKWSSCKNHETGLRAGDFKASDRYTQNFDWRLFHNNGYLSAYHEPIIAVRYLELEDLSTIFKGTYNGKKYTLIYQPSANDEALLRYAITVGPLGIFHNCFWQKYNHEHQGCQLDNQPFDLNFYSWHSFWE